MKILYYNWVPLFDPLRRGGGVRIYQEGLISTALKEGHQVTYLSAGVRYNILRPGLRVLRRTHGLGGMLRECEIVNSPILAPSHHQFGRAVSPLEEQSYVNFILELIEAEGPFDVLHLNNLEGLPLSLFLDRDKLSPKRVLMTLHNYHLVCQQVNLWHAEREACENYDDGRRCTHCVVPPSKTAILGASTFHDIISPVVSEGTPRHAAAFRVYAGLKRPMRFWLNFRAGLRRKIHQAHVELAQGDEKLWAGASKFVEHRQLGVQTIANGMDKAISVSTRVTEIFERYGVPRDKIATRYIATKFAENFDRDSYKMRAGHHSRTETTPLHLAYLGYARDDKGFFFLLKALAALPKDLQRRMRLTFAASGASAHRAWMEKKLIHFSDCSVVDGYTHLDLPALLADVDLGVIPVIWEDCLPQVAYEFVCHGVPILTSDMGGAKELVGVDSLVYKAGDASDFARRLTYILSKPQVLSQFWDNPRMPVLDWKTHWAELFELYGPAQSPHDKNVAGEGAMCPISL